MNNRIKDLRKTLKLTQKGFADRLGVKRNTVAQWEIGVNNLSEQITKAICREFNVSEGWLRTGEGEMFRQDRKTIIDRLCTELHADELEAEIIRAYFRIDEKIRLPFLRRLIQEVQDRPAEPDTSRQERPPESRPLTIDEQVELYRQQLLSEEEQAKQASSAKESGLG